MAINPRDFTWLQLCHRDHANEVSHGVFRKADDRRCCDGFVARGPVLARHPLRRAEYKSQITRVSGGLCRELADALMQAYEWCLRDPTATEPQSNRSRRPLIPSGAVALLRLPVRPIPESRVSRLGRSVAKRQGVINCRKAQLWRST